MQGAVILIRIGNVSSTNLIQSLQAPVVYSTRPRRHASLSSSHGGAPSTKSHFPEPRKLPCHVIRPYQRNPAFRGRDDVLDLIDKTLTPLVEAISSKPSLQDGQPREQRKFALVGIGGIGKTQVALAYAFRSFESFPVILWAHSETRAKLAQSFSEFDQELGLSAALTSNQGDSRERVKRWLQNTGLSG